MLLCNLLPVEPMQKLVAVSRKAIASAGRRCQACGRVGSPQRGGLALCAPCAELLEPRMQGYCPSCGLPFAGEGRAVHMCGECRKNSPPWDGFAFHGVYQGVLRDLILACKFQEDFGTVALLQELAWRTFTRHFKGEPPDGIVPVPLHTARLKKRGFNQSLELVRFLSRRIKRPLMPSALLRTKDTMPQKGLSRKDRADNLKDAFVANAERVEGKRVLLVDDIYTTGSTMISCAKALSRAGAAGIDVMVLARVA